MVFQTALWAAVGGGLLALAYAGMKALWIVRQRVDSPVLNRLSGFIAQGAMTFLSREYRILIPFVLVVAGVLAIAHRNFLSFQALSFVLGAISSSLAGFAGMKIATSANVRTTVAAQRGMADALKVSFTGGSVIGLCIVGFALFGIFAVTCFSAYSIWGRAKPLTEFVLPMLSSFALGASSIAFFARVGGGIFTKAADVGADLVGKLEAGIPEDDPRNPATIADNVGDNVGDVAGMGADLFESYVGSLVGCMILGYAASSSNALRLKLAVLPIILCAVGVVVSIAGTYLVRIRKNGSPQMALNKGTFGAALLMALAAFPVIRLVLGGQIFEGDYAFRIYVAFALGLAGGIAMGLLTEYFTGTGKRPVMAIVKSSETGAATTLITGVGMGMLSCLPIVLVIAAALLGSYALGAFYGVGMAALGMLSTLGIQLAVDAYGPIADNAGGLAEMAELPREVRKITDSLDEVGNTTAAIGKGFAVGSAALTAVILFAAFKEMTGFVSVDLTDIRVLAGLLIGAVMPFFFSSMAINAIGRAAFAMIREVRRQFRTNPGILNDTARPDYNRCVGISTESALREMILPGIAAVAAPVLTGLLGGAQMLMGLLAGVTVSGVALAIFLSNSGGAWDNAKKMIEAGASGGKGSDSHRAAIVGDTVGDPFKDTAGPALNILIKMMAIVSLAIAPMISRGGG